MENKSKPERVTITPTYLRDSGLWVRDLKPEGVVVPEMKFTETSLINIPAGKLGGNHAHPRVELFVSLGGELEIHYLDQDKNKQVVPMISNHTQEMTGYLIPSGCAHAVVNIGKDDAFLLEWATMAQNEVLEVKVI